MKSLLGFFVVLLPGIAHISLDVGHSQWNGGSEVVGRKV